MQIQIPLVPSSRAAAYRGIIPSSCAAALALVLPALFGCATVDRDAFVGSVGPSISQHSAITPLGELALVGVLAETRVSLPADFYGLLQLRNERGDGVQLGQVTSNDYFRTTMELGWDFGLPLGFTGSIGANFVQADLDIGINVDGASLKVAVNRENYGGRLRLARTGEWLSLAGDLEISPVEEAIAGIFELESGRRFGPWSLALRYGQFPEITQAALLLRYRYGSGTYAPPPAPRAPDPPGAPARLKLDPRLDGESDSGEFAPAPPAKPARKRPEWLDEKEPPEIKYVPKKLPDGRPEWADDPPVD